VNTITRVREVCKERAW